MILSYTLILACIALVSSENCALRTTTDGAVCVCNATYCDTVPNLNVSPGSYQFYSTSEANLGFRSSTGQFSSISDESTSRIKVDYTVTHQKIIGFGGAFTDSVGVNIKSLPEEAQEKLIESYFGKDGIEYNLCRVPIGGTDFSSRGYSYDDYENDTTLEHFELQPDDLTFKIPFIQQALELRGTENINLFASAWSAPKWMKTNNDWAGVGSLKDEYYQLWADYTLKFFEEYEKHNITFWGLTTQNEPIDGFLPTFISKINSMGWMPEQMNKWVGENLGPTIRNSPFNALKIILHDDNRITTPFIRQYLDNELTVNYADGIAFHWYEDMVFTPTVINLTNPLNKELFVLSTEASNGFISITGLDKPVIKGSWTRGEYYLTDIFANLKADGSGWVDWNMVLDETGGPTYIDNNIDAPILVNETLKEFYKQPMFYAMGHFSKFILPGSIRLDVNVELPENVEDVEVLAFLRPDNLTALSIFNKETSSFTLQIEIDDSNAATIEIEASSVNTVLY